MYPNRSFSRVIASREGDRVVVRRYDTSASEIIGTTEPTQPSLETAYLMRTKNGRYFVYNEMVSTETLDPMPQEQAITLYYTLHRKHMSFEDAFPGIQVEDA